MSVWLSRAGKHGEFEQKFIQESRIYVTWDKLDVDLSKLFDRADLVDAMAARYPDAKAQTVRNWSSQVWIFAHGMKKGDLVVMPLKASRTIQVGEITSDYHFDANADDPFYHWRSVKWVGESVPRANFGKDLLNTFGAFLTFCRIRNNNAEERIAKMRANGWKPEKIADVVQASALPSAGEPEESANTDLEALAQDQVVELIQARFKGHGLTRLVEAILKAQGYTTFRSPPGADGGADILAGAGPLGFGAPRLCVEVKTEATPIDRPSVDKLLGAVAKFGAQEGLFVSWSGFKTNVSRELAAQFFKVRLWTQTELLDQLFALYEKFDEELKAELPLKRVWVVATQEAE